DAKGATKAAIEAGIVPGGGVTFIQASKVLDKMKADSEDEAAGIKLIKEVLQQPVRMLAKNSGMDAGWVVRTIIEKDDPSFGFNAITNEFGDMIKAGVVEPAKVNIESLKNAASVAKMILTTECLITDIPEPEKPMAGGAPGGM